MKKSSKIALGCVGGVLLTVHLFTGSVSRDVGYHCDFTGSTKSWTKWPLGIWTGYVYETSPIEEFLAKNQPEQSHKEDVIELYETLRREDRDEIRQRVDQLYLECERLLQKLAEHDSGLTGLQP